MTATATRNGTTYTVTAFGTTITRTSTRQVTHALVSRSHRGEVVVTLTRSPRSALAEARRFGDTEATLVEVL